MKKIYALTRFPIALFLVAVLIGCYMPIRFDAEIEITRGGYYDFKFDGYMAKVELFKGLKEGKINPGFTDFHFQYARGHGSGLVGDKITVQQKECLRGDGGDFPSANNDAWLGKIKGLQHFRHCLACHRQINATVIELGVLKFREICQ